MSESRGGGRTGPFTPTPPPSLLVFGFEMPDHGRQRRPKEILLELVEGEKWVLNPCVYTQFFQENPIMAENQVGPNMNTTPVQKYVRDGPYPSG